jgi:Rrf2 family iron-sulfur cluster assembly transcriptional regulator
MKLTSKGRYAATAVLDVALHGKDGPVPLIDISDRQEISLSYLEQLFAKLRRHGVVSSVRGPGGGYKLNRPMEEISMSDIVIAIDEPVDATKCHGAADCQNGSQCLTHSLWVDLSEKIYAFLSEITIADLVLKHEVKSVAMRQDKAKSEIDGNRQYASQSKIELRVE